MHELSAKFISTFLIIIAVSALMRYLNKASKSEAEVSNDGNKILKPSIVYEIVGWLTAAVSITIAIGVFLTSDKFDWTILLLIGFMFIGVILVLYRRNYFLKYDSEKITNRNLWRREKIIFWKDITQVKFGSQSRNLTIKDKNQKINIHYHVNGFQDFLEESKLHIEPTSFQSIEEKINKSYQRHQ